MSRNLPLGQSGHGRLFVGETRLAFRHVAADPDVQVTGRHGRTSPFIFQHGMGGDANQPLGYIGDQTPVPVVAVDSRGHGHSDDIDPAAANFTTFADDVIALADHLDVGRFVIGGISLGAGTALNLAVRYPGRVAGLVLCRPAWLDEPQAEFNRAAYAEIADLLDKLPPDEAAAQYRNSRTYRTVRDTSPAAATSLLGQITRPRAAENAIILRRFPRTSPTASIDSWRTVDVPTLVIGHRDDLFHPYEIAQVYADTIPGAVLTTVPSKDADFTGFVWQIQRALHTFLSDLDLPGTPHHRP